MSEFNSPSRTVFRILSDSMRSPSFVLGILMFTLFYMLIIFDFKDSGFSEFEVTDPKFIIYLVGMMMSAFFMMNRYFGRKPDSTERDYELHEEFRLLRRELSRDIRTRSSRDSDDSVLKSLKLIQQQLESLTNVNLNPTDKEELFDYLDKSIRSNIGDSVIQRVNDIYGETILEDAKSQQLISDFDDIKDRLKSEIRVLTKRANTNLALGSSLTIVAGITLWFTVVSEEIIFTDMLSLSSHFIPRISLIVFIEIFAFFFLKLYKANLNGIKYYHNELTNVDLKISSLKSALISSEPKLLEQVISQLAQTERNFIVPKDSTTIELERLRTSNQDKNNVIELIKSLWQKDK